MPATYTDKIYDILQRENPDADLSTIEGIRTAAEHSLFTPEMLSPISEQHRDAFAAGFALHYLQDEIGYPAFPAWRIALLEKIYNNSAFINLIYENLDKQVFSNYRVSKSAHDGTNNVTTTPNLTDETTHDTTDTYTKAGAEKQTGTTSGEHSSKSNAGKTQTTSNDTSSTESSDTTSADTKTDTTTHDKGTSTNTTANTGTVKNDDTATDTTTRSENYTDTNTPSGSRVTTNSGNTVSTEHGSQSNSGWNQFSDTPQNGLSAVRAGTYLTNATYTEGNSGAYTDTTHNGGDTTTESFNSYKETHTHTAAAADNETETSHTGTSTRTDNTTSKTDGSNTTDGTSTVTGKNSTTASGTTGTTASGTTATEQLTDSTESGTTSGTSESTLTFEGRTDTSARTGKDTTTHKGSTETTGADNSTDNVETYEISMAMLLQSEPLMSRLWRLFDDLFMMVYDTYTYWN